MPTPRKDPTKAENSRLGTRLDSWKEIAVYLSRAERTVKRWETDRALPVHRVPGGGRASVYAYSLELDDWLKFTPTPEKDEPEASAPELAEVAEPAGVAAAPDSASQAELLNSLPAQPVAARFSLTRRWIFACAVLVLGGILVAAFQLAALHRHGLGVSATEPSFSAKSLPKSGPAAPLVVSDAENIQARDLYLKGRYQWNQRTPDSLNRALDSFTQSIVHDPSYAPAYVGLADTYDLLREYSTMPESDAFARGVAAAKKAVELDGSLSEAHRALAFAEFWGNWDFVDAEKEFHRAIELNPKDPVARRWYANSFAMPGRFAECLEQINKAQELDPSSNATLADKGVMLFNAGRTREGIALLKEVERNAPEFRSPHSYMMIISLYLHDYPAFLAEGRKAAEITNDIVLRNIIAAAQRGYMGDGERGLLKDLYASEKNYYFAGKFSGTMLAKTCVMMGKREEALQLLEDAYSHREPYLLNCLVHRDLLTLKDEPRYKALVKKLNFPASPEAAAK